MQIDTGSLLTKLLLSILLPLVIGKILRESFAAVRAFCLKFRVRCCFQDTVVNCCDDAVLMPGSALLSCYTCTSICQSRGSSTSMHWLS